MFNLNTNIFVLTMDCEQLEFSQFDEQFSTELDRLVNSSLASKLKIIKISKSSIREELDRELDEIAQSIALYYDGCRW